jgi:hypothetical protein
MVHPLEYAKTVDYGSPPLKYAKITQNIMYFNPHNNEKYHNFLCVRPALVEP